VRLGHHRVRHLPRRALHGGRRALPPNLPPRLHLPACLPDSAGWRAPRFCPPGLHTWGTPSATPQVGADGFADDGGSLRYEIGSIDGATAQRRPASTGQAASADVLGLPVGTTGVYICARDDAGSELCQTEFVTVSEPAAGFDPVAALQSTLALDPSSQASADQLAGSSQLFAALVNMAVQGAEAPADGGEEGGEEGGEPLLDLPPEVQLVIAEQAASLIGGLVGSVNVEDNDAAQQVLSSVATVASATPASLLTEAAKSQLVDVVQMGGWLGCPWFPDTPAPRPPGAPRPAAGAEATPPSPNP
jgi:hypothetical protein